jgi:hypothetical protein
MHRLRFAVSDTNLNAAIDQLSGLPPDVLHRNAWDILCTEAERRDDGEPPHEIRMPSGIFDTVPDSIQRLLCDQARAETRQAA